VKRNKLRDVTGDPWDARTLEWSTTSPPPAYNFAVTPVVYELDAWHDMKVHGYKHPTDGFRPVHMPRNTATGIIVSALAVALGFGMIWYMWWLAALSFVGILVVQIAHTFNYSRDYFIPAETVALAESKRPQTSEVRA
jgi:cytochrome o ubiquinol oxidase subunit 1